MNDVPPSGLPDQWVSHKCVAAFPDPLGDLMVPRKAESPAAACTPLQGWAVLPRYYTASAVGRRWPCSPGHKYSPCLSRIGAPSEIPLRLPRMPHCAGWPSCSHTWCCSPHCEDLHHILGNSRRTRGTPLPQIPATQWWFEPYAARLVQASGSGWSSSLRGPEPAGNEAPLACRESCGSSVLSHTSLRRSPASWEYAPSLAGPPSVGTHWSGEEPR